VVKRQNEGMAIGFVASNDQNLWMALGRVTWGDAPSRG